MYNTIMIIVLLAVVGLAMFLWVRRNSAEEEMDEYENPYELSYLIEFVNKSFSSTLRKSLKDMNLSRQEFERAERVKAELRNSINESALGDVQAKRFVKASIIGIICGKARKHPITAETIDRVIPFNHPEEMSARDKFETLLYIYSNARNAKDPSGKRYGADGLKILFREYGLDKPVPGTNQYVVTKAQIDDTYDKVLKKVKLSYADKKEILAQRIFEDLEGFGPVDMLLDTSIDEVEGGVSGLPKGSYEFKNVNYGGAKFSYESIWIILSGVNIHLEFLSFGTQEELVRVCNNIYKYDAPKVLSRTDGGVVATMKDGSRIVVMRPPFADSYGFLARKFDSAPSIAPEALIMDENCIVPITIAKWLIKGSTNVAITGDQGTGKTTMLKSFIRFIRQDYSIRVQELTPELNLRYAYPDRNVISFRETDSISSQQGLDFQKKTTGSVNIIGEVATAEAASWIIQTAKVASKMTMFTHHAKTVNDLVVSLRNNLMQVNNYTNDENVDEMIASSLNFDIHLEIKKGHRYISRITEIVPIRDRSYPEKLSEEDSVDELQKKAIINQNEYQKRQTDRILFNGVDLVRFNEDMNRYELCRLPSDEIMSEIRAKLTREEEQQMDEELAAIEKT